MGDVVPGVLDFTKPEQMPSLSKFCLEGCRSNDGMRHQFKKHYVIVDKEIYPMEVKVFLNLLIGKKQNIILKVLKYLML